MERDLWRAIPARGDAAGSGAARGVALKALVGPTPGDEFFRDLAGDDDVVSSGEADLAAVGVAGEQELKPQRGGFGVGFRAVREEDCAGLAGNARADLGEVVGFVEMGIVDARDPEALAVALDACGFVEKDREADGFKFCGHLEVVVVAENSKTHRREGGADFFHLPEAGGVVTAYAIAKIAGEDGGVVGRGSDEIFDHGREGEVQVAMEVAELEQAESLEGAGQAGNFPFLALELDIEEAPTHGITEAEDFEHAHDHGVERDEAFETENAFALVDELRLFRGLAGEALLVKGSSHAVAQAWFHFEDQDSRRSGRRWRVASRAAWRRHFSISPWWPPRRTPGTFQPL